MKITFPHLGNLHIAIEALLTGLGLETVPPPPISSRTFELGVKYSPESACLPLKINVGNFIEALEKGADTIIMAGGWGPCRFGYYAQIEREILTDLGYDFQMIILEVPDFKLGPLFTQIKEVIGNNRSWPEIWKAVRFCWYKLGLTETLEKHFEYHLPRVKDKPQAEKIYRHTLRNLNCLGERRELAAVLEEGLKSLESLPQLSGKPMMIGLVGEVFIMLEPSCNCELIKKLGYLNVEVNRTVFTSDWLNDHLFKGWIKKSNRPRILEAASPYLSAWVGGHGQETLGTAVDLVRHGLDGIIQIAPLTCMPEIVAHSILGKASQEENFSFMTLYFDEHSGSAGVQTRLEAFADMLQRKSKKSRSLVS